jgi:uncharacterized membrane protein YfcA
VTPLIADPLFWLAVIPAVVLLGLAKGGFAGVGSASTPLLALVLPPLEGAAILLPILIVQDVISMWVYRKDFSGWNLKIMIPGGALGIAIAWATAAVVSDAAVRLFIGVIGIGFVAYGLLGRIPPPSRKPSAWRGFICGAGSGFTSTLSQAGSPPFQIHMLPQRLPKMTLVGTTALFFGAINLLKVAPYFALGQFSPRGLTTSLALMPLAIATNFLGIWLVRITPQELFYRIAYALVFAISVALLWQGGRELLS